MKRESNIGKLLKSIFIYIAFLVMISLWGCISSRVHTDYDKDAVAGSYNSFKFTDSDEEVPEGSNPIYHSSLLETTIHAQIATELEQKGIVESFRHPDLLIAYHTYTEKKENTMNSYYPMMYGGWGWRYYPWSFTPYPYGYWNGYNGTYSYTEGTLIIDAINPKTNKLIWRGSISDAVDPGEIHKKVISAVHLIFSKFPLRPGNSIKGSKPPVAKRK